MSKIENNKVTIVWKRILNKVFSETYDKILDINQINDRVNYIITNLRIINPFNLFKCILYSDTNNEIGKLAIDYRLNFISDSYINTISTGESYEIDNIKFDDKHLLDKEISDLCLVINHGINNEIANNKEFNMKESVICIKEIISSDIRDNINDIYNLHEVLIQNMTLNQIIYSIVFNQNIFNGKNNINNYYIDYIKSHYETRCNLFNILHSKYKTGINLSLIKNKKMFG